VVHLEANRMMHAFLANNRAELIDRCKAKVARRPTRAATPEQLKHGIPIFLGQLERTLRAEEGGEAVESVRISGSSGGDASSLSEMGVSAIAHGRELLALGFSIDQVVHDYGDLCQAITDLAVERDAPFGVQEFRTLNRCLDNAIAGAVTEFSSQRDASLAQQQADVFNERLGFLVHELRNALITASLAMAALEQSQLSVSGATGGVLKRAIQNMKHLISVALDEVRQGAAVSTRNFALAGFIAEAAESARLYAEGKGAGFQVAPVDPALEITGSRSVLLAALGNILQNAFKFTRPGTLVTLSTRPGENEVDIDVTDHCGGLPAGTATALFKPFAQHDLDRSGLGLGLSIARRSVEADGGKLSVRDQPGVGCVFTMRVPTAF
jgi:signal transduction histidine kinase